MAMDNNSGADPVGFVFLVDSKINEEEQPPPPPSPRTSCGDRNWAELPRDILAMIFLKLGAVVVMVAAQSVCRSWREVSWEPRTWRVVDMAKNIDYFCRYEANGIDQVKKKVDEVAKAAIARSNGLMEEFYANYVADDQLMHYIADRTDRLKCLGLLSCTEVSNGALIHLAKRSPELWCLKISHCSFTDAFVQGVGEACPQLTHFLLKDCTLRVTRIMDRILNEREDHDAVALGVANTMPGLRRLRLDGCIMTNEGLHAILDRCKHLESLYVCRCHKSLVYDSVIRKKCSRIRDVKLIDGPSICFADYGCDENVELRNFSTRCTEFDSGTILDVIHPRDFPSIYMPSDYDDDDDQFA